MRTLMIAAVAGLLTACATATPYHPAVSDRYGFEEQRIENNRIRITFRGNTVTDRETVETYLLYRAAELTLQNGNDYFIVANRDTEDDPFWDEPSSYREVTRYEAVAENAMFSGPKPADDPNAFDAREVQTNLQGSIVRPPPAS